MFSIKFLTVKQTPLLYSLYFYLKYFKWNRCHFQVTDFVARLHLYYKFILFKWVANHFCKEINLTFFCILFFVASFKVQPGEGNKAAFNDMRALSGGERSFSTVCFILSLWSIAESPFRCLDEFDVYMVVLTSKFSSFSLFLVVVWNVYFERKLFVC